MNSSDPIHSRLLHPLYGPNQPSPLAPRAEVLGRFEVISQVRAGVFVSRYLQAFEGVSLAMFVFLRPGVTYMPRLSSCMNIDTCLKRLGAVSCDRLLQTRRRALTASRSRYFKISVVSSRGSRFIVLMLAEQFCEKGIVLLRVDQQNVIKRSRYRRVGTE